MHWHYIKKEIKNMDKQFITERCNDALMENEEYVNMEQNE
jgi:hypothetical protein